MAYKVAPQIREKLQAQDRVVFNASFEPEVAMNVLEIKQNGVVVAVDAGVSEETYALPAGTYVATLRFWGPVGTKGVFTLNTPGAPAYSDSAKIKEGQVRESIALDLVL